MAAPKAPAPKNYSVSDLKSSIFQPALTSNFEVYIKAPVGLDKNNKKVDEFIKYSGGGVSPGIEELLRISCSEATLPGSSLATHELNNDVTGVTQRHAYRRLYDDRADFTFYVTVGEKSQYNQILYFERWIQYISGEQISGSEVLERPYRVAWPDDYKAPTIYVSKFERSVKGKTGFGKDKSVNGSSGGFGSKKIVYSFFNAYPISIASMPVSYDSSSLLKCTVSFTYDRYVVKNDSVAGKPSEEPSQSPATGVPNSANVSYVGGSVAQNAFTGNASISGNYFNTAPNQNNQQVKIGAGTQAELAQINSNIA